MTDKAITDFFDERKESWLKPRLKKTMSEEEKEVVRTQCEEKFSLQNWIPNAAKRAGQISLATHPPKFSHPSCRSTPVICDTKRFSADGFLRCGNVENIEIDGYGNAAAIPIYKFLTLKLSDGKYLFEHIRDETPLAKKLLEIPGHSYDELRSGFLKMIDKKEREMPETCSGIKQVYFPINENEYHLLSILTNSGIVFRMKKMIDDLRFGDMNKAGREARKKGLCENVTSYKEITDLTMIAYGGGKPQNISVLNNQYGGKAYLLRSMPPTIERRSIRFPRKDFFSQSLPRKMVREIFDALGVIMETEYNNQAIRNSRIRRYRQLMELIVDTMWLVRMVADAQYYAESSRLPQYQKIWLLPENRQVREGDGKWLKELEEHIARWIILELEKRSKKGLKLGETERKDIFSVIREYEEALR
ncbi:type I-F CRISPR-associated protein Csy1 [Hydrogenimonas sp. SS33]|uniref:type I-F CRISPR-associated protein Csy1 n=1 Tax=Hydrogenimonas leucolamina TaxID=2954236 RepID=UPI00336C1248